MKCTIGEGFAGKELEQLRKENAELKEKLADAEKDRDYWKESSYDWQTNFFCKKSVEVGIKVRKQLAEATCRSKRPYP